jgi:uncharacterized protein (TIGR02231 family)
VGKTSILYIAPNEKFTLGWGADANMRVQRTQEKETKTNLITQWQSTTITTKIFLSNIGQETRQIQITERVPIAELEQVKIKVISSKTTNNQKQDKNGFCHWDLTIQPYSQLEIILVYQIEVSPEVKGFSIL